MEKHVFCTFIVVLIIGIGPQQAQAQQMQAKVGPRLGFDRYGFRYFAGADARITVSGLTFGSKQLPILVNPFFSYYFSVAGPGGVFEAALNPLCNNCIESSGSLSRFGANALVNVSEWRMDESEGFPFDLYLGAGLTLSRVSYDQRISVEGGSWDRKEL